MDIQPKSASIKGPAEWFTGEVWIDPAAQGGEPSHVAVNVVHFAPGARTAWHSHTLGQILYVTEGEGLVQSSGEPIVTIRPGDVVRTPAEEWHWHGATHDHLMTHISITTGTATWGAHVTDDEYPGVT